MEHTNTPKSGIINHLRGSMQARAGLAVIILAAVLIELSSAVQFWFAREGIREEVAHRAQSELNAKRLEIENVMIAVEVAVKNMAWAVEQRLDEPDAMYAITSKLLSDNAIIVGSAVAFKPGYYKSKGRQFSPYSYKAGDEILSKQLGSDSYEYHEMEWYTVPIRSGADHWSEPYFDEGGGEMMMSTYSLPVQDDEGRTVAVFTADVSLDWLSDVLNARPPYPSSYNMLLSRRGLVMANPADSLPLRHAVGGPTAGPTDTATQRINDEMIAGKSGQATVVDDRGEKNYVFYGPVNDNTGWSMAVVCADRDIYRELHQVAFILTALMLFGLALMVYIVWRTARSFHRAQQVNAEKERIGSELRIARNIQMSMLPKIFPPYPDRKDIDIYGKPTPAKEVGGDLFDFYIRDEKLFFCIGDVSGKGVPASLVMAVTMALFRSITVHESHPERIVSQLNDMMTEGNDSNMFVTLFIGVLDLPTGRLRYANAGHDAPLLVNADCTCVEPLPVDANLPLGVMHGWKFTSQETLIDIGSSIFLYTDGLTEAENIDHELFGEARMLAAIKENMEPRKFIEHMTEAIHAFVGDAEQSDDLTMLAIKYTRPQLETTLRRSITLSNDIQEVPRLARFVDEVCAAVHFDASTTMDLNLALEEAVVNVMDYAYPKGIKGEVSVEAVADAERLKFIISDSGAPFDPTAKEEVDTTLPVEDRPVGGLGIHLMRQIMDSINYERTDGKNVLTLRKKIKIFPTV